MSAVAVKYPEFKALGVEFLSVSTDSRFTHKIWVAEELSKMAQGGIPFPMLSDAGGKIGRLYGVYDKEGGVDIRGRFLIDPDGIIQATECLTQNSLHFYFQPGPFERVTNWKAWYN